MQMNLKSIAVSVAVLSTMAFFTNTIFAPKLALAEGGGGGYSHDGEKDREGPTNHGGEKGHEKGDDKSYDHDDHDKGRDKDGHEHNGHGPDRPKDGHGKPKEDHPKGGGHDPKPQPDPTPNQPQQPNFPDSDNDRVVTAPTICRGHSADHKQISAGVEADLIAYYDQAIEKGKWVTVWVAGDIVTGAVFKGQPAEGKKWKMTQRPENGHVCVKPMFG